MKASDLFYDYLVHDGKVLSMKLKSDNKEIVIIFELPRYSNVELYKEKLSNIKGFENNNVTLNMEILFSNIKNLHAICDEDENFDIYKVWDFNNNKPLNDELFVDVYIKKTKSEQVELIFEGYNDMDEICYYSLVFETNNVELLGIDVINK